MGRTQLLASLMIACVLKCMADTSAELEEFSDYITRTSQLSPILKSVEADEEESNDDASDHAWEDSGKFEGDLILNERQRRLIVKDVAEGLSRNGLRDGTKRWPNAEVIYYIQVEHFNHEQMQAIQNGIDELGRVSCIKFRPYRKGDRDAVVIQGSRRGCFSQVGYQGGYQVLNLSGRHPVGRGCFRHGTIVHEMLHTLGFYHMQSSPDRDDYVDIQWENIVQKARHNFRKYNTFSVTNFGVGYDYDSVLHYSRRAFSANGQDTIVPKQSGADIGQRVRLSDKDVQKLNRMYCDAEADLVPADQIYEGKKKKSRNKPMDILGIGYHQGNTVVIQVLPKGQRQREEPIYVFDYLRKSPQTGSIAAKESFHVGKGIATFFERPIYKQGHEMSVYNKTESLKNSLKVDMEAPKIINDDGPAPALIEPFDRLSLILKSHVYPSQDPDLNIYKMYDKSMEYEDTSYETMNESEESVAPNKNPVTESDKMKSAITFLNNLHDGNKHKSLGKIEYYYHPENTVKSNHYEDENNSKKGVLIVAELPDEKHKKQEYIDQTLRMQLEDHEEGHAYPSLYKPPGFTKQNTFEKYYSHIGHREKAHDVHDDWHRKYSPYKYKPSQYDSGENIDHSKHSVGRAGYYSTSAPSRIKEYLSPFGTTRYNDETHYEKR